MGLTSPSRKVRLGLLLAILFWGASFIATKVALREASPATIVCVRNALGFVMLVLVVGRRGGLETAPLRMLPLLALLGFLGTTFHQWLQATGLRTASATVTAWIIAAIPIFVAILGRVFLGEALTVGRLAGIGLAAAGVLTVVSRGQPLQFLTGQAWSLGDLLIVASALNWAIYTIISKRALGGPPRAPGVASRSPLRSVDLLLYGVGFGWVFSLPWLAVDGGWKALADLSAAGWGSLAFLGIACSGLGYLFWYDGLESVDATQVGSYLYLEPLVTMALAVPLLGEAITAAVMLGGGAVLVGVWLVNRR